MRLCSYILTNDTGFAPNPFWGYCTLAACTPNHQGIQAHQGDWFFGHSDVDRGRRLIYAMEVTEEPLGFNEYFLDELFQRKKPKRSTDWREACGDNVYHKNSIGEWVSDPLSFHHKPDLIEQDLKHPFVFVSKHYFYFGEKAPEIPARFHGLLRDRQGCKCDYPASLVKEFIKWVESTYSPGVHADPRDRLTPSCNLRGNRDHGESSGCGT